MSTAPAPRIVVAEADVTREAEALFAGVGQVVLTRAELRPEAPFAGALFDLFGGLAPDDVVALVVPGVPALPPTAEVAAVSASGPSAARSGPPEDVLVVRDHVNLALRGPLTGRWPAGVSRSFPCMTGIYQPSAARAAAEAPVYSEDVVAAGVRDAARLTPFERRALREAGVSVYADCLVPAVVTAAFYGLKVAACLVVRAARERE